MGPGSAVPTRHGLRLGEGQYPKEMGMLLAEAAGMGMYMGRVK